MSKTRENERLSDEASLARGDSRSFNETLPQSPPSGFDVWLHATLPAEALLDRIQNALAFAQQCPHRDGAKDYPRSYGRLSSGIEWILRDNGRAESVPPICAEDRRDADMEHRRKDGTIDHGDSQWGGA